MNTSKVFEMNSKKTAICCAGIEINNKKGDKL